MSNRPRALISACLLGEPCRYDSRSKKADGVEALRDVFELIPVCPEVDGGLPTPRAPAERRGDRVVTRDGRDVTAAFALGAERACAAARRTGAKIAVLKARSPSCGSGGIYDGSFSGRVVPGEGVTAAALRAMGVRVYDETRIGELADKRDESGKGPNI